MGILVLPWAVYMCMLLKGKLNVKFPEENHEPGIANAAKRVGAFLLTATVALTPAVIVIAVKVEDRYVELVFKYMLPLILLAVFMILGPFDYLVSKFIGGSDYE